MTTSKPIAISITLTEFEWGVVRGAIAQQYYNLRDQSTSTRGLETTAARYGCRIYAEALAKAVKQLPKAPNAKKKS